jgi:hypothetical protein
MRKPPPHCPAEPPSGAQATRDTALSLRAVPSRCQYKPRSYEPGPPAHLAVIVVCVVLVCMAVAVCVAVVVVMRVRRRGLLQLRLLSLYGVARTTPHTTTAPQPSPAAPAVAQPSRRAPQGGTAQRRTEHHSALPLQPPLDTQDSGHAHKHSPAAPAAPWPPPLRPGDGPRCSAWPPRCARRARTHA